MTPSAVSHANLTRARDQRGRVARWVRTVLSRWGDEALERQLATEVWR